MCEPGRRCRVPGVVFAAVLACGVLMPRDARALQLAPVGSPAATPTLMATSAPALGPPPLPAPLPVISQGVPAFASAHPESAWHANDGERRTSWRSGAMPAWLAYDLSGVPADRRGPAVVAWYNRSNQYDHAFLGRVRHNMPRSYMIDANAAPGGGSPPTTGWVSLVSVTGNTYHSRQHLIDLAGYGWLRINVTGSNASDVNADVAIDLEVHDASGGVEDDWVFYGDSITAAAMAPYPLLGLGMFAQLVNASVPTHFPVQENGGIGGLTGGDGAAHIQTWLELFPGRYVALSYGTNDAIRARPGEPDLASAFYASYATMVEAVLAAGKVPVVPKIPWARTATVQANGPVLNAKLDELYLAYPEIVRGPDFWTYFQENQGLISHDGVHPTGPGYAAYRRQWADEMVAAVYTAPASPSPTR
jgi:lysophospholipase L1-like esterase